MAHEEERSSVRAERERERERKRERERERERQLVSQHFPIHLANDAVLWGKVLAAYVITSTASSRKAVSDGLPERPMSEMVIGI